MEGREEREMYSKVVIRAMKRRVGGGNFGVCEGLFPSFMETRKTSNFSETVMLKFESVLIFKLIMIG